MRKFRYIIIGFALPILLVAYILWDVYFQIKFDAIPTEDNENDFMVKWTDTILIWYYSLLSAYICISILM
jgi:hypothetical protein